MARLSGEKDTSTRQALTLLFTDVVGSTVTASLVGDAEWTPRLRAHKKMLREVIGSFGGRVVDETGDGVFSAFPSTSQALYAAARIAKFSMMSNGELPVRLGVHSGEVEVVGTAVTGVAVHAAARIMALAREGEVTVSRASVDQVRGAAFRFTDAGEHELKGFEGAWHVFRLDVDSVLKGLPSGPAPVASRVAGRLPMVVGAGVLALLVLVGGVFALSRGGGDSPGTSAVGLTNATQPAPSTGVSTGPTASAAAGPVGPASWSDVRSMAVARQQMSAVALPGSLVVAGGLVDGGATRSTEIYEPAINGWRAAADLPLPLHHVAMASWKGQPVVMGGWSPVGARLTAVTSDRVLTLGPSGWTDLPKLLQPRAAGAAVTVGDRIIVSGGQDADGKLLATTEVFDGKAWKLAAPMPTPRDHLAMAGDGRYAYAVGGRRLSSTANLASLERYDPVANVWTALPPMPTARGGLGAAVVGGRLVAVGGETPTAALGTAEAYDIKAGRWSKLTSMPVGRHGVAEAGLDGSVYVLGGALAPTHTRPTAAVTVLDLPAT